MTNIILLSTVLLTNRLCWGVADTERNATNKNQWITYMKEMHEVHRADVLGYMDGTNRVVLFTNWTWKRTITN